MRSEAIPSQETNAATERFDGTSLNSPLINTVMSWDGAAVWAGKFGCLWSFKRIEQHGQRAARAVRLRPLYEFYG